MFRNLSLQLQSWAAQTGHKPLLLTGPRQSGKTWLIKDLAERMYDELIRLDFEQEPVLLSLFSRAYTPLRMLDNIQVYLGRNIDWNHTLLFFDGIQAAPGIVDILPVLGNEVPHSHLIAAGSVKRVNPVKRVDPESEIQYLTLYPLTFKEFLAATGEEMLAERLDILSPAAPFPEIIHKKLIGLLARYIFLGGMPEVINTFVETGDILKAREKQASILTFIEKDLNDYGGHTLHRRLIEVWRSIPEQLKTGNKKFRFNQLRTQGRSVTYIPPLQWLENNRLINTVKKIRAPRLILREYEESMQFKIYPFDTGLLGAWYGLSTQLVTQPLTLFSQKNEALIETFVAAELNAAGYRDLFYWSSRSDAEVDFLVLQGNQFYPLEVKSVRSQRNPNLRSYHQRYHPTRIFTATPNNIIHTGHFTNLPLYAISMLARY